MTTKTVEIQAEVTPNPNSLRFVVNQEVVEGNSIDFPNLERAAASPLALGLFEIEGVAGVLLGKNFVTVTKLNSVEWIDMAEPVSGFIQTFLESDRDIIDPDKLEGLTQAAETAGEAGPQSDIEQKIIDILDNEIRPAVAMDGGDVQFHSFKDGIVTLHLQGACSSCPSATMTLKMGIENRLREEIPEVKEVIQL